MPKGRFRFLVLIGVLLTLLVTAFAGCSAARKPGSPATPTPPGQTAPGTPRSTAPAADPRVSAREAARLADVASKVPGVRKAYVVLSGTTAYVGLDLKPGEEPRSKTIQKDVASRVKRADARIRRVMVTTDPDLVTRIKRVSNGIAAGRPISAFTREMSELNKRLTPTSR